MSALEQSEQLADRVRADLQCTLEELEQRLHRATDLGYQLRTHPLLLTAVVGGLALGAYGILSLYQRRAPQRRQRHRQRLRQDRKLAVQRSWRHPERVATRRAERPLPLELGRKVAFIFVTALASGMAGRMSRRLFAPPTGPRLSASTH